MLRLVTSLSIGKASLSIDRLVDLGLNLDSEQHSFLGSLLLWKESIYFFFHPFTASPGYDICM